MERLFIGLPLDHEAVLSLDKVQSVVVDYSNILKIVPPENYHITMQFLGNVNSETTQRLIDEFSLFNKKKPVPKIFFQLIGLGAFPNPGRATVLWAGIKTDLEKLNRIKKSIEEMTSRHGIPAENRAFKPHLTLARVKKDRKVPQLLVGYLHAHKDTYYADTFFHKIVLYKSELTKEGPVYTELSSIGLA